MTSLKVSFSLLTTFIEQKSDRECFHIQHIRFLLFQIHNEYFYRFCFCLKSFLFLFCLYKIKYSFDHIVELNTPVTYGGIKPRH